MISSTSSTPRLPTNVESSSTRSITADSSQPPKPTELPESADEDASKGSTQYPSALKYAQASNTAQKGSFTIGSALKISPKLRELLNQRTNIEATKLQRDDPATGLLSMRSPNEEPLLDRRTASAGYTPGPKSSSRSSLNKASKRQDLLDRRPSLKLGELSPRQKIQQRSSSVSSPSPDPFLDRKDPLTGGDIAVTGGAIAKKTYLTSARRDKANSQLSADLRPRFSSLTISYPAPPTTTPTPHRPSGLSVSFDSLPISPPPRRPPPDLPLSSPVVPTRSTSRLVVSKLKPLRIPSQISTQEDLNFTTNQGALSPAQTPKSSKLNFSSDFAHISPREKSVSFFPPPSPPRTSSPVSARSVASSSSGHSTHSITSITEDFESLLQSPEETSAEIGYCSFTARKVTLSRPKITVTDSQFTEKSDMDRVANHQLLKRLRKDTLGDITLHIPDDEDPFVIAVESTDPLLEKQPPTRKLKIESVEGAGSVAVNASKTQAENSPQMARSADAKKPLTGPAYMQRGNDALETVKARIRLREDRLQQKLLVEQEEKNTLLAELGAIKEEAREINKRKKEKEAEIHQIGLKITATHETMDKLEQARETLTGVKRLLK